MSVNNGPSAKQQQHRPPSTFDLLRWSDTPHQNANPSPVRISATNDSSAFMSAANPDAAFDSPATRSAIRTHQPAGGTSSISFGSYLSAEEAEALQKRRPGSESKRREMHGSGIFSSPETAYESPASFASDKPAVRVQQPAGGASQISFGVDGSVSPKKPTSLPEVAKQKELCGTIDESPESPPVRRPCSSAKAKELVGSNIFGPPPDMPPRCLGRSFEEDQKEVKGTPDPVSRTNSRTSVKVSNPAGGRSQISFGRDEPDSASRKVHNQKVAELSGNNIFRDAPRGTPSEKTLSVAKLKEMSGSDIFADEKPVARDCVGGIRKPPGGESSLTLL